MILFVDYKPPSPYLGPNIKGFLICVDSLLKAIKHENLITTPGCPERYRDGPDSPGPHQPSRPLCHHHLRHHRPRDVHGYHAPGEGDTVKTYLLI